MDLPDDGCDLTRNQEMSAVIGANLSANCSMDIVRLHKCMLYDFYINGICIGLLCVFGLVGNAVSFSVFHTDRIKTSSSFLFKSLACLDSVLLIVAFPLYSITAVHIRYGIPGFSNALSLLLVYVLPVAFIAQTASAWLTVLIGVNRYIAVCRPYQASSLNTVMQSRKYLIVIVLGAVIYNVPRFFESYVVVTRINGTYHIYPVHTSTGSSRLYMILYVNLCYSIFLLGGPLTTLSYLNVRLIKALKNLKQRRSHMQCLRLRQRQEQNMTMVLIVVIVVFIVCQVPALVTQIFWVVLPNTSRRCDGSQFYFSKISNMLLIANSAVNFVIYFLFNSRFRQELMKRLNCLGMGIGLVNMDDNQREGTTSPRTPTSLARPRYLKKDNACIDESAFIELRDIGDSK